ncbi:hypothetical protein HND73_25395 [Rhodococcus ruber]|nr:hypothetical protein [Rhodococcus ruber]
MSTMCSDVAANLLDTVPGRMLVQWHLRAYRTADPQPSVTEFVEADSLEDFVENALLIIREYLYGNGANEILDLPVTSPAVREMSEAICDALRAPSRDTLVNPQVHQGAVTELSVPRVRNRARPGALPDGAFWTATPLDDGTSDTWGASGENLRSATDPARYTVHFDPDVARIVRIDTADDWAELIAAHPLEYRGAHVPDWPSIAERWDAVHLSALGLLCAHPRLSEVPYDRYEAGGYRHSQSGPWPGVGDWSTVSTAWLRIPERFEIRPTDPVRRREPG